MNLALSTLSLLVLSVASGLWGWWCLRIALRYRGRAVGWLAFSVWVTAGLLAPLVVLNLVADFLEAGQTSRDVAFLVWTVFFVGLSSAEFFRVLRADR